MVRVCNYFDSQLHVPVPMPAATAKTGPSAGPDHKPMAIDEMLVWFGKILDAVKMRYRKLQRFAR
jgi:mitogen-activated protein kinase kinase kinase